MAVREKRADLKTFQNIGHGLPLLLDEETGRELVKSSRKREDDVFKIDGKRRYNDAFTGGFSAVFRPLLIKSTGNSTEAMRYLVFDRSKLAEC